MAESKEIVELQSRITKLESMLYELERTVLFERNRFFPKVVDEPKRSFAHRFEPTPASTTSVDISAGSWTRNGTPVTSAAASGIGDATNHYIVATLDDADAPTTLTVAAADAVPTDDEQDTKRLICNLEFTSGVITKIYRHQLGDIQDQVALIQAADNSWSDGGDEPGVSWDEVTDIQYDVTTYQFQKKTRTHTIVNGRKKISKESGWTMITGGQGSLCVT